MKEMAHRDTQEFSDIETQIEESEELCDQINFYNQFHGFDKLSWNAVTDIIELL